MQQNTMPGKLSAVEGDLHEGKSWVLEGAVQALLNASTETALLIDSRGKIMAANRVAARRMGKRVDEIVGLSLEDILSPDIAESRTARIDKVLHSGKPVRFQDGREGRQYDNYIAPVLDQDGKITGIALFAKDTTEAREAREAVQERERYFRSLLDNMHEDILVIDRNYLITDVNKSFVTSTGHKRREVIGRHCFEISHGHNEPCKKHGEDCGLHEVFNTGNPCNLLHKHLNADGSISWLDCLLSPLLTEEGEITHVIEAMRDVSDVMETRQRLEESERHYKTLFNSASEAICIHDAAGRFLEVNQAACDCLGYVPEEFLKMKMSDLEAPGYGVDESERMDQLFQSKQVRFETVHVAKDGALIPMEVSSRLIDYSGKPAVLSIALNISDRKQAEKEKEELEVSLRQAQKMEAIGTLAGGIAHDFNNILGAVMGISELALLDVEEGTTLSRHLKQVLKACERARDLTNQILAFSRQQEEKVILFSMKPIVKEALKLLGSSLPSTIVIRHSIEADPGLIKGDPTQIHQVLMNLCTNAAHAMQEKGGILEVKLRKVELQSGELLTTRPDLHEGPYVCLSVSDTGYGITPEVIDRIFDPYFTTKGVGEGTGLGLAVVQGIVRKHKGTITVESEPDRGATFSIYIPRVEEEDQEIRAESPASLPMGNERILFVDDEELLTHVGKGILEGLGYEVTARTSSREALELFKTKPEYFDLVITDMNMPNLTGERLAGELMKIRPGMPIILCTGFSHVMGQENARRMGIRAFVMKPVVRMDLAKTVRRVLDGKEK